MFINEGCLLDVFIMRLVNQTPSIHALKLHKYVNLEIIDENKSFFSLSLSLSNIPKKISPIKDNNSLPPHCRYRSTEPRIGQKVAEVNHEC